MRPCFAALLLALVLAMPASAQVIIPNRPPAVIVIRAQTAVSAPDGGSVLVGSYSRAAETRYESGTPGLGKIPVVGRGFRNVGYGRSISTTSIRAGVRIINLRDEEFRQTGFRSP